MVSKKILKELSKEETTLTIYFLRFAIKVFFLFYELITFIPYKLFANPEWQLQYANRQKAVQIIKDDPCSPWRPCCITPDRVKSVFFQCKTLAEVWDKAVEMHQNSPCFGTRTFISMTTEVQKDGRVFEKYELGSYQWRSYVEVNQTVNKIMKGLARLGHQPKERILVYSETREEFTTTLLACFKSNFPVTTVYTTLGQDALTYSMQQCKPSTVFATPKLSNIKSITLLDSSYPYFATDYYVNKEFNEKNAKSATFRINPVNAALNGNSAVRRIIYFSHRDPKAAIQVPEKLKRLPIHILTYAELIEIGNESAEPVITEVTPDDIAMIMYTSGTTAVPKGVVMSHKNLVASVKAHGERFENVGKRYAAFLPLAHIFEVCAELVLLTLGCKLGFSSALTLVDGAPGLKEGQLSDSSLVKPTFFAGTPAVYNRIIQKINEGVSKAAPWKRELLRCTYEYLDKRHDKGYSDILLKRLMFKSIRVVIGGEVKWFFSAGAPMSPECLRFMKICFGCCFTQGFGCTETTGCGMFGYCDCLHPDEVGPPEFGCEVMLREWSEGGYSPYNRIPQGEILIGGDGIAIGYINNEKQTKEAFLEMDGKRWFATGDIAEVRPDGSFLIIDRKKDLVKLAQGEYISFGKVEAFIASMPYIENICIFGNQMKDYVIAIIVPREDTLFGLAKTIGVSELNFEKLCQNEAVKTQLLKEIQIYCKDKLQRMEIPRKLHLCHQIWTPVNGLVTAAFKVKRKCIEKKYEKEIRALYA